MNEGIVSARYAKALYQSGEDENITESIRNDITLLIDLMKDSEEFNYILNSPVLKENKKNEIIRELFTGKIMQLTLDFLLLLISNKRELLLNRICHAYLQLYKKEKGITEGKIITAQALEINHHQEINKYINQLFKIDVELNEIVDPGLIGGFKLILNDTQIDASISSKLKKIKSELINS